MSASTWRIIAQRILTCEFLDWQVPLENATRSRDLSGPGGIEGTIEPELRHVLAADGRPLIEEWSTALYYEEDGLIRAGGIVQTLGAAKSQLTVSAPGFASYPSGMPCVTDYTPTDFQDPLTIYRNLWAHLQNFPDGNLGMQVSPDSSYYVASGGAGPYRLGGWEYKEYGTELDNLAQMTPFDYVENHTWNANHSAINHTIQLGFPRLGRKRADLRFAQDENVTDFAPIGADGTNFSNELHLIGLAEGRDMPKAVNAVRDGRLRRPQVVSRKFYTQGQANSYASIERRARELKLDISQVTVREHPNAPISAIVPGDDVFVEVEVPWYGAVAMWLRVLGIEESISTPGTATLKTRRSDFFVYAAEKNPNPDGEPIVLSF